MGLKTTYYLRTLAASSIEKSSVSLKNQKVESTIKTSGRGKPSEVVANIKQEVMAAHGSALSRKEESPAPTQVATETQTEAPKASSK